MYCWPYPKFPFICIPCGIYGMHSFVEEISETLILNTHISHSLSVNIFDFFWHSVDCASWYTSCVIGTNIMHHVISLLHDRTGGWSRTASCWPLLRDYLLFIISIPFFNVYGFVHRKYIPIYIQQDASLYSLVIPGNCSTCFGRYFHPSSGAHTTVSTASGICHTVTATCIASTCFGWYLHPSSGAHTTVPTASGICHTVTATCIAGSSNCVTNIRCC
jgi:hypothetical protein